MSHVNDSRSSDTAPRSPLGTGTGADAVRAVLTDVLRAAAAGAGPMMVGEGVGRAGGIGGSSAGLAELHPDRVIDLPVADRGTAGFALGLALAGRPVVVELSGTGRLPALLEVLTEAGASAGEFSVPLVVRVPYGSEPGIDAPVGRWLLDLPGVRVVCGSSPGAVGALLRAALASRGPTVLLEPRSVTAARGSLEPGATAAQVVREGRHVTLVAWGDGVAAAERAADTLAADGIEADVIDLVSLAPLDRALVGRRVRATGRLVVVHPDDPGLARRVRELALDEAFLHLEAPLAEARAEADAIVRAARAAVEY